MPWETLFNYNVQQVSIRARHCWRAMHWAGQLWSPGLRVSIRARHCWRAMPWETLFNYNVQQVSIRARHCWRAMRLIANALQTHGFVLVTRERG